MTFTIHLIFTFLAGIIFRPLFTTFCSCFVIIFLEKITFLRVKHMVLHLMFCEFLSRHYMENLFYLSLTHLQFSPRTSFWYRYAWVLVFRKMSFLIHLNFTSPCRYNIQISFQYITWICLYFLESLLTMIPHKYCLLEFCKITFTIHYIFTFLAGIIFRPYFTTLHTLQLRDHGTALKVCLISFSRINDSHIHCNFS